MTHLTLSGKHGVAIFRCSTPEQTATSIPAQEHYIKNFFNEQGLIWMPPIDLAGKSGSHESIIDSAVDEVIRRKENHEQIDYLVTYDNTRRARTGINHWGHCKHRLLMAHIHPISVVGWMANNPMEDMTDAFGAYAAQEMVRSIANASARGSQLSLLSGLRTHTGRTPYGLDRLYLTLDGRPLSVVRDLADGSRQILEPDSGEVRQTLPRGVCFEKPAQSRIDLIPGADDRVAVVRRLFRMRHLDGCTLCGIARILNDEGTPGPKGVLWSNVSVTSILRNPVYLGRGRSNGSSKALYWRQHRDGPQETGRMAGDPQRVYRPMKDWHFRRYEHLRWFLPREVRKAARRTIVEYLRHISKGGVRGASRKKNNGRKLWPLSGLIIDERVGAPMVGMTSGRIKHRYYMSRIGYYSTTSLPPVKRALLPAEPIERFVLEQIEGIICSFPGMRGEIEREIRAQQAARLGGRTDRKELRNKLDKVDAAIVVQNRLLEKNGESPRIEAEIERLHKQARDLDHQLKVIGIDTKLTKPQITKLVDTVIQGLEQDALTAYDGDQAALRKLCEILVDEAVANPETRIVSIKFAIPGWMFDINGSMLTSLEPKIGKHTSKWKSIPLVDSTVELPSLCDKECRRKFQRRGCESVDQIQPKGCEDCLRRRSSAA